MRDCDCPGCEISNSGNGYQPCHKQDSSLGNPPTEDSESKKINYAKEQRLRFIDFMLFHYGQINRVVHSDYFGIGEATATRDFREYNQHAPENMVLDQSSKRYIRTLEFKRVYA